VGKVRIDPTILGLKSSNPENPDSDKKGIKTSNHQTIHSENSEHQ